MAVIKVSIKDNKTLELQEDAKKGDVIDLSSLSIADVSSVSEAVKLAAKKEAEHELAVLKQKEIEAELLKKEKELNDKYQKEIAILENDKNKYSLITQQKNEEIAKLKTEQEKQIENEKRLKETEIKNSIAEKEKEILSLRAEIAIKDEAIKTEIERKNNVEITLKERMKHQDEQRKSETERVIGDAKREKEKLEEALKSTNTKHELHEQKTKEYYERLVKDKEQEIERLKNMKAKLSTKLIGQSLEEHCELEFEQKMRPFISKNVYFGKDNEAKDGTKGDYIYCEKDENGVEIISIMFEMKNEEDGGVSAKKKNDDHLKKLNDDRNKKNCEYAVLVSMLEPESELYNSGIVDKSYKYQKMYVIRPQFFIPIITLLRNAAAKVASLKNELIIIKEQSTDITNFEDNLSEFKLAFGKNAGIFTSKISSAIEKLEKQKKQIQDIIDLFKGGQKQLDWAGDKLEDLSVKKLTKDNPTMAAKFEEIRNSKNKKDEG